MVGWWRNWAGKDLREYPFAIVLLIEAIGVVSAVVASQHWLRAVTVMTIGMVVAGIFRLVLSNDQAGLLRVRRRSFDVACYWTFGVLAFVFALALPSR